MINLLKNLAIIAWIIIGIIEYRNYREELSQLYGPAKGPTQEEIQSAISQHCDGINESGRPLPALRNPPNYPYDARKYDIEGWVELEFTVLEGGETANVVVTNATNDKLFGGAAILAVQRYRYCQQPHESKSQIRIKFEIAKNK